MVLTYLGISHSGETALLLFECFARPAPITCSYPMMGAQRGMLEMTVVRWIGLKPRYEAQEFRGASLEEPASIPHASNASPGHRLPKAITRYARLPYLRPDGSGM